ncbi:hypothetical protein SORBI_3001G086100 [Sorghum bicolor]|uniref:Uncharacterized protein n=1 Tax=Sorghum bicolor TaxID=4558 RepID=A0A1B6QHY8_SORBI|nr:hypothetical protein SORBI_3001G086100 [Sorghum bicolor]
MHRAHALASSRPLSLQFAWCVAGDRSISGALELLVFFFPFLFWHPHRQKEGGRALSSRVSLFLASVGSHVCV